MSIKEDTVYVFDSETKNYWKYRQENGINKLYYNKEEGKPPQKIVLPAARVIE